MNACRDDMEAGIVALLTVAELTGARSLRLTS